MRTTARNVALVIAILAILIATALFTVVITRPPELSISTPTSLSSNQDLQFVLLRGSCRSEYLVNANEPILIYYGGWSTKGIELSQQWSSALDVSISIDGTPISGEQHSPADELPLNCKEEDQEDIYWLYYTTTISKLSPGVHEVSVTFNILKSLSDGLETDNYPIGKLAEFTFKVTAK